METGSWYFQEIFQGEQKNDRKVKRGVISTSLAINTAILANLPREIIKRAKKYIAKN